MKKMTVTVVVCLLFGISMSGQQPDPNPPAAQLPGQQQPTNPQQTPDSATKVQSDVQKAFQQDPTLAQSSVSAQVGTNNTIVLTGTVQSQAEKDRAEQVARAASAGMRVDNKIKVSGSSSPSGTSGAPPTPPHFGNSFMPDEAAQYTSGQSQQQTPAGQTGSQSTGSQAPNAAAKPTQSMSSEQGAAPQIQSALQQEPSLAVVKVTESASQIERSGSVARSADKKKAKTIADQYAAGKKVVDNINVSKSR